MIRSINFNQIKTNHFFIQEIMIILILSLLLLKIRIHYPKKMIMIGRKRCGLPDLKIRQRFVKMRQKKGKKKKKNISSS